MAKFNHASRGITKDVLITKGQRLVDQEHDDRLKYCCVQLNAESFVVWNFEKENLGETNQGWPWTELPRFHRVRKLVLHSHLGKHFIKCSCGFRERVGIPCRHMLCVLDGEIDINMMDVRLWKAFHKHYGEESKIGEIVTIRHIHFYWIILINIAILGDLLYSAQQACFDAEKLGCPMSQELYSSLIDNFQERTTPYIYEGTSENGFNLAMKVMQLDCCTESQFNDLCASLDFDLLSSEELTLETIKQIKEANIIVQKNCHLSKKAKIIQDKVTESAKSNTTIRMTSSEMASVRKEIETMMENMFTDPRVSKQDIMNWQVKVIEARSEMVNNINEQFGKKGGGNGTKQWHGTANPKGLAKRKRLKGLTG